MCMLMSETMTQITQQCVELCRSEDNKISELKKDVVDDIDVGLAGFDFLEEEVEASDYSTENNVESEGELVGDDDEEEYGNDVPEEVRELRVEKRKFQRRKRNERVPADNAEVPVGEVVPDLGFDETEIGRVSYEGRLGGDEPYFASSDEDSFVLDEDDCCDDDEHEMVHSGRARTMKLSKKRTKNQKIIHDPTAKEVVCQLRMVFKDMSEFRKAVTKYVVRKRVLVEKWVNEPKKITVRKARSKVLKEIMGDHVVEFGRILDYKDELLRTNPGTSCVVKLGEADEAVEKQNTNTWTWFIRCIRDDLRLEEGESLTLITDMQKKTIIFLLEEIRVKMMTRIGTLREFPNTWCSSYSPRCLKILEENINRALDCTIKFNGVTGFEVKEGLCQHTVDIIKRTYSYRLWQLKGIPCAHGVAALLFKKHPLYDYIDSCYSKETYLRTYANVLKLLTNMKMWPVSSNITVAPPKISTLPSRPSKSRKKEAGETKKSAKLPRTGLAMTSSCSAPSDYCASSLMAGITKKGRGNDREKAPPLKRSKVMGMGVFQDENGFKVLNPGMPSSKICSIGHARVTRSADITGNIGYTPSTTNKLKLNGKVAI
ncbi:putative C2 and GRAM domain-containing protein-like [Capsicum annuum]|nr:putative C2 and GRAM domain-containing protein-like [Capsicum annuum]